MRYPESRLLVFCKAPVAGRVKTRLVPPLNPAGAARLHRNLAQHTLDRFCRAGVCPVELWCSPDTAHPFFAQCRDRYGVTLHAQAGADLGQRMHLALEHALAHCACAVLIGCDCPTLAVEDVTQAVESLASGADAVLGPAEDGGYVLVGLCRPRADLFCDMAWGTGSVLEDTRRRLDALNLVWCELAPRWDVDRPEDLDRLTTIGFNTFLP